MEIGVAETQSPPTDGIPVIDESHIPQIALPGDDWRARYDELREQYPFFRVGNDPTVWFSRYEAARTIFTDHDTFTSVGTMPIYLLPGSEDPPFSTAFRGALMPEYSVAKVKAWEPRMREIARDIIARFAGRGRCDYVTQFAHYYFPYVGADWIGIPREDWDQLVAWERDVFKVHEGDPSKMLDLQGTAMFSILGYIDKLVAEKRERPDDRFASFVLGLEIQGRPITDDEAKACIGLAVLGSGHTVSAHLGYLFKFFAEHPDVQRRLAAEPESIETIGEEVLRAFSLFGHERITTRDTELDGCRLKAGTKVFVAYSMVNRDPRCAGWDHMDLDRNPNRHMAFNMAGHRCLGIHWARAARRIAVEEWHKTIPSYRLDESEPLMEQVYAGVGYHHLPLVWQD